MIVHHRRRWVYVGIPKTASTALHGYLPKLGGKSVGEQHTVDLPPECLGYLVFATSLNPFRRAYALWKMLGRDAAKGAPWSETVPPGSVERFDVFVRTLLLREEVTHPVLQWTVSRWLQRVRAGSPVRVEVIPAERLDAGLRRLGVLPSDASVPVVNRTQGSWLEAYDRDLEEAVRRWAEEDFRRFGYPAELRVWRRRARWNRRRVRLEERIHHARSRASRWVRGGSGSP